ncbi:hypothetical protein [Listeria newyorkensis]|uniref:Uncharacterized protein n=1 Tax=Listeria newyorkensis TaxID=1497681 RepID=A0A841Z1W1_9LIST|nr:hypothetical protein [Listeria newyorkensis]MBC1458736.1 hypothetical protein [Listeria newyorkensis]
MTFAEATKIPRGWRLELDLDEKRKRPVQLRQKLERPQEKAALAFCGGREVFEELAVDARSGSDDTSKSGAFPQT